MKDVFLTKLLQYAIVIVLLIIVFVTCSCDRPPNKDEAPMMNKIANIKIDNAVVDVIGIYFNGQQCFVIVGQSNERTFNIKADLICP